jgi:hypothetical protein
MKNKKKKPKNAHAKANNKKGLSALFFLLTTPAIMLAMHNAPAIFVTIIATRAAQKPAKHQSAQQSTHKTFPLL